MQYPIHDHHQKQGHDKGPRKGLNANILLVITDDTKNFDLENMSGMQPWFQRVVLGYTLTFFLSRPMRSNRTTPSVLANNV